MKSKTVGLQTKLGLVRRDLAAISYPRTFDEAGAVLGKPCALIPVLRFLLEGEFSPIVASQFEDLRTTDRVLLLGRNFVNLVFLFANEVLKIKTAVTAAQFMLEVRRPHRLSVEDVPGISHSIIRKLCSITSGIC